MKLEFIKEVRSYFRFGTPGWMFSMCQKAETLPQGCIIDIETTGLNPDKGDYYHHQDHILTLGIYRNDRIFLYQLVKPHYDRFRELCQKIVSRTPTPRYAYCAHFEQSFLGVKEGWFDLAVYGNFRRHPYPLIDVTKNPCGDDKEERDIEGSAVPICWSGWLHAKSLKHLTEIPFHCLVDLLREAQLVQRHKNPEGN